MTKQIIEDVLDEVREWTNQDGTLTLHFISGTFDDGDQWSIGVKPENVEATKKALIALIDKEREFTLEKGNEYNGVQQWKLKDYPGKPKSSGDGGGKKSGGDWETFAERQQKNRSFQAQKAAGITSAVVSNMIAAGAKFDLAEAMKLVELGTRDLFALFVELSGELQQSAQQTEQKSEQKPPEKKSAKSAKKNDDTEIADQELTDLRDAVVELYGTRGKALGAHRRNEGEASSFNEISAAELQELIETHE